MKISIVTLSFNQRGYLQEAMDSVLSQGYNDLEYIVVDPGSTDGSREVIKSYGDRIAHTLFEPDRGAADGLNFGFVVVEAMACSTPVLISDKVNIWREVQSARAGLVEPDTLEGTRNLIRGYNALSDQERAQLSRNARSGFLEYFDVDVTARDFAQAIGFETTQLECNQDLSNSERPLISDL